MRSDAFAKLDRGSCDALHVFQEHLTITNTPLSISQRIAVLVFAPEAALAARDLVARHVHEIRSGIGKTSTCTTWNAPIVEIDRVQIGVCCN